LSAPEAVTAVRDEAPGDCEAVDALHEAAFGQRPEADLVKLLRADAAPALSLVAEVAGAVVGHVFVSPGHLAASPSSPLLGGVGPLGVNPAHQRRGVGSVLMRAVLERAPTVGWQALFLLGNPAYYARFGFELAAPRGLRYTSPAFDPAFQVLELEVGCLDGHSGAFLYHPAFDAV